MIIPNKSHYYNEFSKYCNKVLDKNSFEFESTKRNGYFQRLYFEYLYTQKVNGITFFFTLTYNDKSIPKFLNYNVFSYKDIRYITNGALSKRLLREYGASLKYFCACESGEGKGKRGFGNNPHYHFIFFVQPANDFYKVVPVNVFTNWLKELWLGTTNRIDYRSAKYGIVKEGKLGAVVTNSSAFRYCAKYCIKDSYQLNVENDVYKYFYNKVLSDGFDLNCLYNYYKCFDFNKYEFWQEFKLSLYHDFLKYNPTLSIKDWIFFNCKCGADILKHLDDWFKSFYVPRLTDKYFNDFLNNHSGKVRCSKLLGSYGFNFVKDISFNPHFEIPSSKGYLIQKPCLFYIRHLYYDTFKCPVTGNVLYRLNDSGIELKMNQIDSNIDKLYSKTLENLSFVCDNHFYIPSKHSSYDSSDLDKYLHSIGNVSFSCSVLSDKCSLHQSLLSFENYYDIVFRYCVYTLIYKYRIIGEFSSLALTSDCLSDEYKSDYYEFLLSSIQLINYDNCSIYQYWNRFNNYDILNHPAFAPYRDYFDYLDCLNDSVNSYRSDIKKQKFNEDSKFKKLHNACINS